MKTIDLFDPKISYNSADDKNVLFLIDLVRQGIKYNLFFNFVKQSPFSLSEWSVFLHISERTLQRYKNDKKTFDQTQSEKILEIAMLYKKGIDVFGDSEKFNRWLETDNLAFGKIKPKSLLDSSFGINMLKDELTRIEYGVLA